MRALIEDTKKLTVNNNFNCNNNSNIGTTVVTKETALTATSTKNLNLKVTSQPYLQQTDRFNSKTISARKPTVSSKAAATTASAAISEIGEKTSFTNKTYKMQQQQQQQHQQTTITNTTNTNFNNKGTNSTASCTSPATAGVKLRTKQPQHEKKENSNNNTTTGPTSLTTTATISLPKASHANTTEEIAGGVQDTIYLCNFRVSVDGEWLCLKELQDVDSNPPVSVSEGRLTGSGGSSSLHRPYSMYSQKHKRYSAGDRNSYGGGGCGFEDNGIFALHNFIAGRRLYDEQGHAFHTNMLTAPHARESGFVGVFGGGVGGASQSSNEWSNLFSICCISLTARINLISSMLQAVMQCNFAAPLGVDVNVVCSLSIYKFFYYYISPETKKIDKDV